MFRNIKKLPYVLQSLILLSCLFLSGCSKEIKQEKVEAMFQPKKVDYNTVSVTRGDFISEFSSYNIELIYNEVEIKSDKINSKFLEFRVRVYDVVKKGDVIAVLNKGVSKVNLEEKQLAYERSINQYYSDSKAMVENLNNQEQALVQMPDGTEKEIAAVKLEQAKVRYEQFLLENERNLEQQKKDIEKQENELEDNEILAPFDGMVISLSSLDKGDEVNTGDTVGLLAPTEQFCLGVKDSGDLRYNMEVTVTSRWGTNEKKYKGRVAFAKNIAPDGKWDNKTYIKLEDPQAYLELQSPSVTAEYICIKNVLLLDSTAITKEILYEYVTLYENDKLVTQHVSVGKNDNKKSWILQGLSENQKVIIN